MKARELKNKSMIEFQNFLTEEIHLNFFMFPFKITSLNFQYKNKTVRAKAEAIDFRISNLESTFISSIEKTVERIIENNFLTDEEFDFQYDREEFNKFINTKRITLINWFNDFLYQFNFIESCTIHFNRDEPFLTEINHFSSLTTRQQVGFDDSYAQDLMLANLKDRQIIDLQAKLDQNREFIQNREYFNLIIYCMGGLIYCRSDYDSFLLQSK